MDTAGGQSRVLVWVLLRRSLPIRFITRIASFETIAIDDDTDLWRNTTSRGIRVNHGPAERAGLSI